MISQQNIYPPKNWQDFEMLCLKLWGEIWNTQDDIEFNSDNSSGQDGVDIYCIPKGENGYYGIQCKNKNLYRKNGELNVLTKATIDEEINRAKKFTPALKKLIIATSIGKDKALEEYVREVNIKHIQKKLFKVQLCFWDYISRKIVEYEDVTNWYLKNENFKRAKSIKITFENGKTEIEHSPKFIKTKFTYRLQTIEEKEEEINHYKETFRRVFEKEKKGLFDKLLSVFRSQHINLDSGLRILINGVDINSKEYIESTYPKPKQDFANRQVITPGNLMIPDEQEISFKIKLFNNGDTVIDDYKLHFSIIGEFEDVKVKPPRLGDLNNYNATTWINKNHGLIEPDENFIVQQDSFTSKEIILIPKIDRKEKIILKWKLLSRDFTETGQLAINIIPKYIETKKIMYVLKEEDCKEEIEYSTQYVKGRYTINY